ncbi:hypothetical protein SLS58_009809 [Diplodia intermedia]|uniref:Uncharacterized protein n=1 Tax=Diplodia intermedia TaxID=856260 RepID=A0ABR3TA39_9PEZI
MPAADSLQKLRREIDRKPHKIKRVLTDVNLRREFFDGIPNDEKAAVRAFAKKNAESALKVRSVSSNSPTRQSQAQEAQEQGSKASDDAVDDVMPDAPSSGDGSGAEGDE